MKSLIALLAILPLWLLSLVPGVSGSKWHRDASGWVGNVLWED